MVTFLYIKCVFLIVCHELLYAKNSKMLEIIMQYFVPGTPSTADDTVLEIFYRLKMYYKTLFMA